MSFQIFAILLTVITVISTTSLASRARGGRVAETSHPVSDDDNRYVASDQSSSSDWSMLSGRQSRSQCVEIPSNLTLCRDIGYQQMRLPNLLEQDSIREVTQQASSWNSLLNVECHPNTKLFLCSLFSPVCLDQTIWPCRSLCLAVKAGCEGKMLKYGYRWPEMLDCAKFPTDNELCIGLQTVESKETEKASMDSRLCPQCSRPDTVETIVDNYCNADFAVIIKIENTSGAGGNDMKIIAEGHSMKILKDPGISAAASSLPRSSWSSAAPPPEFHLQNGSRCDCPDLVQRGRSGAKSKKKERNNVKYVVMGNLLQQQQERARQRKGGGSGSKMIVTFLKAYDPQRSGGLKEAMKAIRRKGNLCEGAGIGGKAGVGGEEGASDGLHGAIVLKVDPEEDAMVIKNVGKDVGKDQGRERTRLEEEENGQSGKRKNKKGKKKKKKTNRKEVKENGEVNNNNNNGKEGKQILATKGVKTRKKKKVPTATLR